MSSLRFLAAAVVSFAVVAPAAAQPIRPVSMAALRAAQAKGEPILVDVFAPWCPTCRAQAPAIDAPAKSPASDKLVILRLDFDNRVAETKALDVRQQSMLILSRGNRDIGRMHGGTDPGQIEAFAMKSLG